MYGGHHKMFMKSNKNKPKGLQIIIVGCGKVGMTLVEQLSQEGHDITIIDKNANIVQSMSSLHDVMGIVGNGASYSTQMEAGIESTDLIIAVTDSDELNLLCCIIAKRVGDCAAIARVRTPDYSKEAGYLREKLGLTMIINPELEASAEAARILYLPTALEVNSFAHGQAEMVKFKVTEGNKLAGNTIALLGTDITENIVICAVERNGEVYIPSGNFQVEAGDVISFVASRMMARTFLNNIGFKTNQVKDTMIIGGGNAAYYLAKQLLHMGTSVKIIESDRSRCEQLSILLPKAIIINGDGSSEELLKEEGIQYAESFVPLTGIDEENIMLTMYAKNVSNAKVITKINRMAFRSVINRLDLGSVIYPRYITSEAIIAYVRAKKDSMDSNIETLYHMFDHRVEAIEFRVYEKSAVTGIPLKNLSLKEGLLISFINRNGKIIIPSGHDSIEMGDTVMIVTTHTGFNDIQDILK
jgi:trk system potassium uptake protein TrkA